MSMRVCATVSKIHAKSCRIWSTSKYQRGFRSPSGVLRNKSNNFKINSVKITYISFLCLFPVKTICYISSLLWLVQKYSASFFIRADCWILIWSELFTGPPHVTTASCRCFTFMIDLFIGMSARNHLIGASKVFLFKTFKAVFWVLCSLRSNTTQLVKHRYALIPFVSEDK